MRIMILIALLFAFIAGAGPDMAHASVSDHACAHHQTAESDNADSDICQPEHNQGQCYDCCCLHSHSMANSIISTKSAPKLNRQNIFAFISDPYSAELSGLKRPPRL